MGNFDSTRTSPSSRGPGIKRSEGAQLGAEDESVPTVASVSGARPAGRRNRLIEATLTGIDEMQHFPTEKDRRRAIRSLFFAVNRDNLIAGAVLSAACIGAYIALVILLPGVLRLLPFTLPAWAPSALCLAGTYAVYFMLLRPTLRYITPRGMRRRLLACGVPICLPCGYPLKGLSPYTDRCPECGRQLSARVRGLLTVSANETGFSDDASG